MFYKIAFYNGAEQTAGLVLSAAKHPTDKMSVEAYSRMYPAFEVPKMKRFWRSALYPTFEAALNAEVATRAAVMYLES